MEKQQASKAPRLKEPNVFQRLNENQKGYNIVSKKEVADYVEISWQSQI